MTEYRAGVLVPKNCEGETDGQFQNWCWAGTLFIALTTIARVGELAGMIECAPNKGTG